MKEPEEVYLDSAMNLEARQEGGPFHGFLLGISQMISVADWRYVLKR